MITVAVLFARGDSVYKTMPGVDVWDKERDALQWPGGCPVVGHPPCRAWGRLRHFAKPAPGEKYLAVWAVQQVRRWGGVLEHPSASALWPACGLPRPGTPERDSYGGWTMPVDQHWWGHRARKPTLLYVVGCPPPALPHMPFSIAEPEYRICFDKRRPDGTHLRKGDHGWRPEVSVTEREATPPAFAEWLCDLARRCSRNNTVQSVTVRDITEVS